MNQSSSPTVRFARYALYLPACVAVSVACGQATTTGPEGSSSSETSSTASSSSTAGNSSSTASSSASSTASSSNTATSTGATGQTGTSSGATGQSGTSSGASGQSGSSSGESGSSGGSGQSSSSGASSASTSATSGGSSSTSGNTSSSGGSDASSGSESTSGGGGGEFTLTSTAHEDGAEFDDKYTCASGNGQFGSGVIPPLAWANAPTGAMSFAITFIDTKVLDDDSIDDSQAYHWAMWDIPADVMAIMEAGEGDVEGAQQASPLGGFFPPCPGGRDDTYSFTIYAIPTATLDYSGNDVKAAETAIKAVAIDNAVLTGTSNAGG